MWTGAGDFFNAEFHACITPVVLDRLLWGIVGLVWLKVFVQGMPIFHHHFKQRRYGYLLFSA
jgi:hypothetical protein